MTEYALPDGALWSTDSILCPHCKHPVCIDDAYYYNESGYELECSECEMPFRVQPHCSWSWTTKPVKAKGE